MARKKSEEKTVSLKHSNGATVSVREEKVDRLLGMGFTKPTSSRSTKSD